MRKQQQPCPHCGQPIEGVYWKATIVRFNISKAGIIGAAPFDTLVSVPPGEFWAQPCGHELDQDAVKRIIARARQEETQE